MADDGDDHDDDDNSNNVKSRDRKRKKNIKKTIDKRRGEKVVVHTKKFQLTMVFIKTIFIKRTMEFILTANLNLIFAANFIRFWRMYFSFWYGTRSSIQLIYKVLQCGRFNSSTCHCLMEIKQPTLHSRII